MTDEPNQHLTEAPPEPQRPPRKVYRSTLFEERPRRRASPWVIFPVLLLILIGVLSFLYTLQHRVRFISTAGEIVYASDQGSPGTPHLWITAFSGANSHLLTPGPDDEMQPVFAPNGSQIAFLSDRDQNTNQLFLIDADGKGLVQVTHDSGDKTLPAWQNGQSGTLGYIASGAVYTVTMGADIGTPDRLLPPPPTSHQAQDSDQQMAQGASLTVPSFALSPSSTGGLAAVEDTGDFQALAVMPSLSGSSVDMRQTPQGNVPLFAAGTMTLAWSPTGSLVAAAAINVQGAPRPTSGIFLFEPNGNPAPGPPPTLVGSSTLGPQNPVFSPDGTQILFEAWSLPDLADRRRLGLFIVPTDGSQPPRLVYRGDASDAQFSPDGSTIFFLLGRPDGGQDLCRVAPDGSGFARLTNGPGDVTGFSVSPQVAGQKS
jgi:hypothetical protein